MADTGAPGYLPLASGSDMFAPPQAPLNALATALNTALSKTAFNTYPTLNGTGGLNGSPGTTVGQHASVNADSTATNNGDYVWSGSAWLPYSGTATPHWTVLKSGSFDWTPTATDHTWDTSVNEGVLAGFSTTNSITYTCTIPGVYNIQGQITTNTGSSPTNIVLFKGSSQARQTNGVTSSTAYIAQSFDYSMRFAVGETFKIQISSPSATVHGVPGNTSFMSVDFQHA